LRNGSEIHGRAAPGFEEVADEFARNFAERDEVGAAFAAVRDGETVVDLWGGLADRSAGRPWREDTLQLVFSGTKGLVAVCVLLAIERRLLELDAQVSRYWPAFGKDAIRVRDVVSHTARLPGLDAPAGLDDLTDPERMARRLEAQEPSDDPRAAFCYHALTYGWLCGELIRRVDGRTVGRFFADEVAAPLGLELWLGLPAEHEHRVSTIELAPDWPRSVALRAKTHARDPLARSIWGNPPVFDPDLFPWNRRDFHAAEIPAVGAIGTARSLATMYASLDRVLRPETLALARTPLAGGFDEVHRAERSFGVGFALQQRPLGPGETRDEVGHGGAGGSGHAAWPEAGVGFSYAMNLLRDDEPRDPRAHALLAALHRSLG
jgi:CubicO group peptidase (beta-lactamase class C family)